LPTTNDSKKLRETKLFLDPDDDSIAVKLDLRFMATAIDHYKNEIFYRFGSRAHEEVQLLGDFNASIYDTAVQWFAVEENSINGHF
jgi:hypothetical protein